MFNSKKITALVSVLVLILLCFTDCGRANKKDQMWKRKKENNIWIYYTDYTEEYRDILDAMFDNNWTVKRVVDKYEEPEGCDHVDTTPIQYKEWTIGYFDNNGDAQEFILNNTGAISTQVKRYLEKHMRQYYEQNFLYKYLDDELLEGPNYIFSFFVRVSQNPHTDENQPRVEKIDAYTQRLNTVEGALCLSRLSPQTVFVDCPLYLSVHISIKDWGVISASYKEEFQKDLKERVMEMLEDINDFTGTTMNVSTSMGIDRVGAVLYDGERGWAWYYIDGIDVGLDYGQHVQYEQALYDSYAGIFWD